MDVTRHGEVGFELRLTLEQPRRPRELAELLVHATTTKPTGALVPD